MYVTPMVAKIVNYYELVGCFFAKLVGDAEVEDVSDALDAAPSTFGALGSHLVLIYCSWGQLNSVVVILGGSRMIRLSISFSLTKVARGADPCPRVLILSLRVGKGGRCTIGLVSVQCRRDMS
jgi:hypothetical protein